MKRSKGAKGKTNALFISLLGGRLVREDHANSGVQLLDKHPSHECDWTGSGSFGQKEVVGQADAQAGRQRCQLNSMGGETSQRVY